MPTISHTENAIYTEGWGKERTLAREKCAQRKENIATLERERAPQHAFIAVGPVQP